MAKKVVPMPFKAPIPPKKGGKKGK